MRWPVCRWKRKETAFDYLIRETGQRWSALIPSGVACWEEGFRGDYRYIIHDRVEIPGEPGKYRGVNMFNSRSELTVMYIRNGKPISSQCYTEKYGVQQCMIAVWEKLMQKFGTTVDDGIIEDVLRYGKAKVSDRHPRVRQRLCGRHYEASAGT